MNVYSDGYEQHRANGRRFPLRRFGPWCLFWRVVCIVLNLALTVVLNLGLFALGGWGIVRRFLFLLTLFVLPRLNNPTGMGPPTCV